MKRKSFLNPLIFKIKSRYFRYSSNMNQILFKHENSTEKLISENTLENENTNRKISSTNFKENFKNEFQMQEKEEINFLKERFQDFKENKYNDSKLTLKFNKHILSNDILINDESNTSILFELYRLTTKTYLNKNDLVNLDDFMNSKEIIDDKKINGFFLILRYFKEDYNGIVFQFLDLHFEYLIKGINILMKIVETKLSLNKSLSNYETSEVHIPVQEVQEESTKNIFFYNFNEEQIYEALNIYLYFLNKFETSKLKNSGIEMKSILDLFLDNNKSFENKDHFFFDLILFDIYNVFNLKYIYADSSNIDDKLKHFQEKIVMNILEFPKECYVDNPQIILLLIQTVTNIFIKERISFKSIIAIYSNLTNILHEADIILVKVKNENLTIPLNIYPIIHLLNAFNSFDNKHVSTLYYDKISNLEEIQNNIEHIKHYFSLSEKDRIAYRNTYSNRKYFDIINKIIKNGNNNFNASKIDNIYELVNEKYEEVKSLFELNKRVKKNLIIQFIEILSVLKISKAKQTNGLAFGFSTILKSLYYSNFSKSERNDEKYLSIETILNHISNESIDDNKPIINIIDNFVYARSSLNVLDTNFLKNVVKKILNKIESTTDENIKYSLIFGIDKSNSDFADYSVLKKPADLFRMNYIIWILKQLNIEEKEIKVLKDVYFKILGNLLIENFDFEKLKLYDLNNTLKVVLFLIKDKQPFIQQSREFKKKNSINSQGYISSYNDFIDNLSLIRKVNVKNNLPIKDLNEDFLDESIIKPVNIDSLILDQSTTYYPELINKLLLKLIDYIENSFTKISIDTIDTFFELAFKINKNVILESYPNRFFNFFDFHIKNNLQLNKLISILVSKTQLVIDINNPKMLYYHIKYISKIAVALGEKFNPNSLDRIYQIYHLNPIPFENSGIKKNRQNDFLYFLLQLRTKKKNLSKNNTNNINEEKSQIIKEKINFTMKNIDQFLIDDSINQYDLQKNNFKDMLNESSNIVGDLTKVLDNVIEKIKTSKNETKIIYKSLDTSNYEFEQDYDLLVDNDKLTEELLKTQRI